MISLAKKKLVYVCVVVRLLITNLNYTAVPVNDIDQFIVRFYDVFIGRSILYVASDNCIDSSRLGCKFGNCQLL